MTALLFETDQSRAPPPEHVARDYVSFSALKTYQQCPLRYYFRYVAQLPEETCSPALIFGSAIHKAIEQHFHRLLAGEGCSTLPLLLDEYRREWQERAVQLSTGPEEHASSFGPLAEKLLAAFLASDLSRPSGQILAVEETLRGELCPELPELLGRVDLILEEADCLVIRDWKTARSRYSPEQVDDAAPQLLLYGHLAAAYAPGKRIRLELGVLTKTKEPVVARHCLEFDPTRLSRVTNCLKRIWAAIQEEHFYPAPSPVNCPGCPYQTACRNWPG